MHFQNASASVQLLSYCLLAVVMAAFLVRAAIFFRRQFVGIRPRYPSSWTPAHCKTLEWFRLAVCLAIIPLWIYFAMSGLIWPNLWPIGFLSFVSLVLVSHAWVTLITPRDWTAYGRYAASFSLTLTFLVLWWGTMLAGTGWMLSAASASVRRVVMPIGVFASLGG